MEISHTHIFVDLIEFISNLEIVFEFIEFLFQEFERKNKKFSTDLCLKRIKNSQFCDFCFQDSNYEYFTH